MTSALDLIRRPEGGLTFGIDRPFLRRGSAGRASCRRMTARMRASSSRRLNGLVT
jgi:hypothetical protein